MTTEHELFARCASGFEATLSHELKGLGMRRVRPLQGGVSFFGSQADAYAACLWSRVATRIQLVLARVSAQDAEQLYANSRAFAWEAHLSPRSSIRVIAHGNNDELRNTKFVALKVKDAICDRLRSKYGARPDVDPKHPDLEINVAVHERKATLFLNLSGESLHRRGYRLDGVQTEAPLKETLAAGMLLCAQWPDLCRSGACFVDPMCGSGTLAIEAALIASNTAPGLLRTHWGFEAWRHHDKSLWESVRNDAWAQVEYPSGPPTILAGDIDSDAVRIAQGNAEHAQVDSWIRFFSDDAAMLSKHLRALGGANRSFGLLATNPPYGMRLLSSAELPVAYDALAHAVDALGSGWKLCLITPDAGIDASLGRTPGSTIPCHNGPIPTWVRTYALDTPALKHEVASLDGRQVSVPLADAKSVQFAGRLRKMARERMRWARKEHVSCYRIYDADLPDYPLSVDLYQGVADDHDQRYVRILEGRRPEHVDPQQAQRRLADAANIASAILGIDRQNAVVLPYEPTKRSASQNHGSMPLRVEEANLHYEIDLQGATDALPLCLREVRSLAASLAADARVAALFYSSAPSMLRAIAGGARTAVLVDSSSGHLSKAERLLRSNRVDATQRRMACADVRTWLKQEQGAKHEYDLILCTPPTWLPKNDAGTAEWDLRRECASLVLSCARVLSKNGVVVFCHTLQDLRLDPQRKQLASLRIQDVSQEVVPHDFERSRTKPQCYLVRR